MKSNIILDICRKNYKYGMLKIWNKYAKNLENFLEKNNLPLNFLSMPLIKNSMFVNKGGVWQKLQLKLLNKSLKNNRLKEYLKESIIELPTIKNIHFIIIAVDTNLHT